MLRSLKRSIARAKNAVPSVSNTTMKLAVVGGCLGLAFASKAEISLPLSDVVTDVTTLTTAAIVAMGGVVTVCMGGQTAFALLRKFGGWIKKALG